MNICVSQLDLSPSIKLHRGSITKHDCKRNFKRQRYVKSGAPFPIPRGLTSLVSPSKNEAAWPPRSPYHALLSSPSGRRKLGSRRECLSPSPSPSKPSSSKADHNGSPKRAQALAEDSGGEDEETLQLELQAIEARLKLKRLQQAKARRHATSIEQREDQRGQPPTRQREQTPPSQYRGERPAVQVPLSPSNQSKTQQIQRSPARIALGIDKGLRAESVSLKRASSTTSQHARLTTASSRGLGLEDRPKKSFSERIAESRLSDRERQEKQERLRKSRSQGFNLQSAENRGPARSIGSYNNDRNDQHPIYDRSKPVAKSEYGSGQRNPPNPASRGLHLSNSVSHPTHRADSLGKQEQQQRNIESRKGDYTNLHPAGDPTDNSNTDNESVLEPYSGFHLSKRLITHNVLTRAFESKETFTIPRLFKDIKSPNYDPPDTDGDYVVFAVVASKSTPYDHKNTRKITSSGGHNDEARSKFMAMRLTDFKWELDLYLFGSGFETFWKLTVGTVVAILNPGIMPPKNRDTGAFSLKVTSNEDTILEIGKARDLGFCKSVKKDGKECGAWVDKRSTEYCEFHVSMLLDKTKAGRMEVNGMSGFGKRKDGGKSSFRGRSRGGGHFGRGGRWEESRQGEWHDAYLHETMYIAPGASTARLLDAEDANDARDKAEIQRKRKADLDRENELATKLALTGSGSGKEYLQVRRTDVAKENVSIGQAGLSSTDTSNARDAASLGLLGNKASDVTLSPVRRGRALAKEGAKPLGWGGASRKGLLELQPKQASPERERSPSKKKARFMLERGIRQPGRESLGDAALATGVDDEELEII